MSYNAGVEQLQVMGISPQVAQYALTKMSGNLERAIDWIYTDEGAKYAENPTAPSEGDHRPPANDPALEVALRTSAAQVVGPPTVEHVSGERNITGFSNHDGATVSHNEVIDVTDDKTQEDKEFEAAIAMSLGVREGAPPPPSYGPSNKIEDGSTAMVPSTPGPTPSAQADSDADLDRAIQDSLMTASFHSMSAIPTEAPPNYEREPGMPIVLRAADPGATYAAHMLQALYAVPHFRDVIRLLPLAEDSDAGIRALQQTIIEAEASTMAYHDVGAVTTALRKGYEPYQLPPLEPLKALWENFAGGWLSVIPSLAERLGQVTIAEAPEAIQRRLRNPLKMLITQINASISATYVNINRSLSSNILAGVAQIMWIDGQGMDTIRDLGDIMMFLVGNGGREAWKMEEVIYMDRFMKSNAARSAQLRAEQGLAVGESRRLRDTLQTLTVHKEQKILDSLQRAIKYYDESPEVDDVIYKETVREMKLKLQQIHDTLKTKVTELEAEVAIEEHRAAGGLFETSDPEYLKHGYRLNAALWYDGFPSGLGHLYAYVRAEDGSWFKLTDQETTKTDFATIANDRVGLYTDGGPYMLLYAREGQGPPTPVMTPVQVPVALPDESEFERPGQQGQEMMEQQGEQLPELEQVPVEEPAQAPATLAEATADVEMVDGEQTLAQVEPADSAIVNAMIEQGIS